jgi:hypothetical protein
MTMRCLAKDRNNNGCRNHTINDTRFCKFHDYMIHYTDEMIENSKICSGCKKLINIKENEKTCDKCRGRVKERRNEFRENIILCKKDGCKFKRADEKGYCNKHQICILIEEVGTRNKRLCVNYIRGCRYELDLDHTKNKCENCLEKDREKDKQRRDKVIEESRENITIKIEETINNSGLRPPLLGGLPLQTEIVTINTPITEKSCTVCCKKFPIAMFEGTKGTTKTCSNCRASCKKNDEKRDKEHRNEIARKNDAKPERIIIKQKWKENNYEKVAETWMKSRQNRIDTLGMDEYQRQNTENAKKWRDNNPEKVLQNNENKKNNLKLHYNIYIRSARDKNLEFTISSEEYERIVCNTCYYCNITADKGFNGMDRKDQTQGYTVENCVNCCKMCNYMKKSLNDDVFVKRIEHILSYNQIIKHGKLYPHLFANHNTTNYNSYKYRANNKKNAFEITESQFVEIISKHCYICGKINTNDHCNGIDRFNNNIGYLFENCRTCCGECNYMKNNYSYDDIFEKFRLIYNHTISKNLIGACETKNGTADGVFLTTPIEQSSKELETNHMMNENDSKIFTENKNKKSKEEIRENARIRKQEQRKRMVEKYGDEEYRKMHAKQVAENRKKKQES